MSNFKGTTRLSNNEALGSGVSPLPMLFMSVIPLGFGVVLGSIALGLFPEEKLGPQVAHWPPWLFGGLAATAALPGIHMLARSLGQLLSASARTAKLRQHPDEPWLADHPWHPEQASDRVNRLGLALMRPLFLLVFLGPVHAYAVPQIADSDLFSVLFFGVFFGVFDLIFLVMCYAGFVNLKRRLQLGSPVVRYSSFPLHTGEPLNMTLRFPRGVPGVQSMTCALRFVEEAWETTGPSTGSNRRRQELVRYERYRDEQAIDLGRVDPREVALTFALPADAPQNHMDVAKPSYWELHVVAKGDGLNYEGAFPLPVYA